MFSVRSWILKAGRRPQGIETEVDSVREKASHVQSQNGGSKFFRKMVFGSSRSVARALFHFAIFHDHVVDNIIHVRLL